jgi:hypothetical protein
MLAEVKRIRCSLEEVSESTARVSEAIRAMLNDENEPGSFEEAYRAIHEDL